MLRCLTTTMADPDDDEAAPASPPPDREANHHSFVSMRLAELLRVDISPVTCLDCVDDDDAARNRPACPCFATLHPFCDLFHTWLSHRLIDNGAGTCCMMPAEVIPDPDESDDEEESEDDEDEKSESASAKVAPLTSGNMAAHDANGDIGGSKEEEDAAAAPSPAKATAGGGTLRPNTALENDSSESSDGRSSTSHGDGSAPPQSFHSTIEDSEQSVEDEGPFDPLTERLRALATTVTAMVHELENNVGDLGTQRTSLLEQLLELDLTVEALPLAQAEILSWYSVLSILACSFPTRAELQKDSDGARKGEGEGEGEGDTASILNGRLLLPPLLLNSSDAGQPLRPQFLGAASEQHAGQWFMGLQGLRENPATSIENLCTRRWRMWQQSHCKYLNKSVRALRTLKGRKPRKLLHEWLAVNDYCDWVQQNFVELFTAEVRLLLIADYFRLLIASSSRRRCNCLQLLPMASECSLLLPIASVDRCSPSGIRARARGAKALPTSPCRCSWGSRRGSSAATL